MDDSVVATIPDDDHLLGPFLGKLPPEILDVVVKDLGWFQTTFASAGKACRDTVKRVPDKRVVPKLTCMNAALGGHLEVLKWARQNGCPWNEETCWEAAGQGHLEMLQWARANGCPWDVNTWATAAAKCRPYLIEHGCPGAW